MLLITTLYFLLFHKSRTLYFMGFVQSTENDFMKELLDYRSPVRTETSAVLVLIIALCSSGP